MKLKLVWGSLLGKKPSSWNIFPLAKIYLLAESNFTLANIWDQSFH